MIHAMDIDGLLTAKKSLQLQFIEGKEHFSFQEAARCCCALANCGGGQLVFGIADGQPRRVVGSTALEQPESACKALMEQLKVPAEVHVYSCGGKRVLVVAVSERPLGMPVLLDGVAWWYDACSHLIPMPEEIRRKIYEEEWMDFSRRICPAASLDDLDEQAVQVFRVKWAAKGGRQDLLSLSTGQLFRACGAVSDEGIPYAALILFGRQDSLEKHLPHAKIIYEYRTSKASGTAAQKEEFSAGLFSCLDRLLELVDQENSTQLYQDGMIYTFHLLSVREAILNAVCHRKHARVLPNFSLVRGIAHSVY